VALTVTPGGPNDDSYVTLDEADAYFAGTLRAAAWTAITSQNRELALRQATREIEGLGGPQPYVGLPTRLWFSGTPRDTSTPQALHFPRSVDITSSGAPVIPQAIRAAVCEQAAWLLNVAGPGGVASGAGGLGPGQSGDDGIVNHGLLQSMGIASWSMDGQSYSYRDVRGLPGRPPHIAESAWAHVRPYIVRRFRTRMG